MSNAQIKYPFREVAPRRQARSLARTASVATAAGGASGPERAAADLKRARAQLTRVPLRKSPPRWVLSFVERGAPSAELIERLRSRAAALRSPAAQADALQIANELGRSPRTAKQLARALTAEVLTAIRSGAEAEK
jgi:hypothetical protein